MKKQYIVPVFLILLTIVIPSLVHAQPAFGDDVEDVPIDGGLSLLIASGVGYGIKKMRKKRKKSCYQNGR